MNNENILEKEVDLPKGDGMDGIVHWHVFRRLDEAERFIPCIKLGEGQQLVGGRSHDSVGEFWWLGVRVDDLDRWGSRQSINKHAVSD